MQNLDGLFYNPLKMIFFFYSLSLTASSTRVILLLGFLGRPDVLAFSSWRKSIKSPWQRSMPDTDFKLSSIRNSLWSRIFAWVISFDLKSSGLSIVSTLSLKNSSSFFARYVLICVRGEAELPRISGPIIKSLIFLCCLFGELFRELSWEFHVV